MKKILTLVCLLVILPGIALAQQGVLFTREQAVYGVLGGLNHAAAAEWALNTDPVIISNTLAANSTILELADTNIDITGTTSLDLTGPASTLTATTSFAVVSPISTWSATTSFGLTSPSTTITAATLLDVNAATALDVDTATSTLDATTSHSIVTPLFNWTPITDYGGYTIKQYFARGTADGTGGFDIEVDIPSGAIVLLSQTRVDVLLAGDLATWSAAFIDGSTASLGTGLALTQNTKTNTWFDANGATAILSAETDVRVTPNTGNITAGSVSAYVTVMEPIALANAKVITYSGTTFSEHGDNDGSIDNSSPITLTLAGDTYVAGSEFVAEGHLVPTNVPTGLTVVATRTSSTVLTITITGNATAHANANDVSDLTFTIGNGAFTSANAANVTNATVATLAVDFSD